MNIVDQTRELIDQMDNHQLNQVFEQIRYRRDSLTRQNVRKIFQGDQVKYRDGNSVEVEGTVVAVKRKYIHVSVKNPMGGSTTWRVPASMLELV